MKNVTNNTRKKIPPDTVARIMVASRQTCNLCWKQKEYLQIHHVVSVAHGGDNSEDNLILLCPNCHASVHSKHDNTRNYTTGTLKLFRETWFELVRKHPILPEGVVQLENDIQIISEVLKNADRRVLYWPLRWMSLNGLLKSFSSLQNAIQKSGYRLLFNQEAKEHITQINLNITEILVNLPYRPNREDEYSDLASEPCLFGSLTRNKVSWLEVRRGRMRFNIDNLAFLLGHKNGFFVGEELNIENISGIERHGGMSCFNSYAETSPDCSRCEFSTECISASLPV
ncbi:MAG: HNH endonuclease [Proteobacteria bacterium]|nr:HNH endonuclease [Pseudomonadota bacterium]